MKITRKLKIYTFNVQYVPAPASEDIRNVDISLYGKSEAGVRRELINKVFADDKIIGMTKLSESERQVSLEIDKFIQEANNELAEREDHEHHQSI